MKVIILVPDDRSRESTCGYPVFGSAPTALIQGLSEILVENESCSSFFESFDKKFQKSLQIHVVSCSKWHHQSPTFLLPRVFFHSVRLASFTFLRLGYLGPIFGIRQLIRKIQPSLVHAQGSESWCAWTGAALPVPKILTLHGIIKQIRTVIKLRPSSYWLPHLMLERLSIPRYDLVLCNSQYSKTAIRKLSNNINVIANPVRLEFFRKAQPRLPNRVPILLCIGVVQERKRQLEICRLGIRMHRKGIRFKVRFIGLLGNDLGYPTEFREALFEAHALGVADFLGTLNAVQLVNEMDKADGLIHFPLEEAFGLVVAEAVVRNLRIFASDVGGISEVVAGFPFAQLFSIDDWVGLENALSSWICSHCWQQHRKPLAQIVRFHPRQIAARHLEIYNELYRVRA